MGTLRLGQRSYISSWLLRSAKREAARALAIEQEHPGDWSEPHVSEHMDIVVSSVLSSAVFLEAMINELYTDAHQDHPSYVGQLDGEVVRLMAAWWEETNEGFDRTLAKYQLLLSFAGLDKMNKGTEPYQSADLLLRLRNAIVHYRPETIYADERHKLADQLSSRVAKNGLFSETVPMTWPNGVLSADCARWAHESAEAFADEVSTRLGIKPNYMALRE